MRTNGSVSIVDNKGLRRLHKLHQDGAIGCFVKSMTASTTPLFEPPKSEVEPGLLKTAAHTDGRGQGLRRGGRPLLAVSRSALQRISGNLDERFR